MENEELKKQIEGLNTKVDQLQSMLSYMIVGLYGGQCIRFFDKDDDACSVPLPDGFKEPDFKGKTKKHKQKELKDVLGAFSAPVKDRSKKN